MLRIRVQTQVGVTTVLQRHGLLGRGGGVGNGVCPQLVRGVRVTKVDVRLVVGIAQHGQQEQPRGTVRVKG